MTWTVTIRTGDGNVTGTGSDGAVPPGTFEITGSDDGNRVRLAVHQHDAEGRFVTSAEHVLDRAEKALHEAEADVEAAEEAGAEAGLDVEGSVSVGESIAVTRE